MMRPSTAFVLVLTLALFALLSVTDAVGSVTHAQELGTSQDDLLSYRADLALDADARERAIYEYSRLSVEAEAVIRARVAAIRAQIRAHVQAVQSADAAIEAAEGSTPDAQRLAEGEKSRQALRELADAITEFRKAAGGELASDIVDIADGIQDALEAAPQRADAAEVVLLARALERIGTPRAIEALGDLLASHKGLFRWELTRLIALRKERFVPFLIAWQDHPQSWVSSKAKDALEEMKVTSAGRAFALAPDAEQLVRTLAVYQHDRSFDAMEAVASLMNHPAIRVRTNARKFIRWYGRNAIWQLRRLYRNQRGEDAPKTWGWKKVYTEVLSLMRDDSAYRVPVGVIEAEPQVEARAPIGSAETAKKSEETVEGAAAPVFEKTKQTTAPSRRTGPNLIVLGLAAVLVLGGGYWSLRARPPAVEQSDTVPDAKA